MSTSQAWGDLEDDHILDQREAGPTVFRMLVGSELRRLREAAEISRAKAGYAIRASDTKISRLELGRTGFKPRDVADLLTLYGVTGDAERQTLLAMAEQANTPGWWHAYSDVVPSWFEAYIGLEQAAAVIRTWEVQFVPGLLQTEDYARAVIRLGLDVTEAEVERRVRLRMRRQRILSGPDAVKLWAVIDEAALRRPVGGPGTMRAQVEHLLEIGELPNVTVQVMPLSFGGHSAGGGPIAILRLPAGALPDVVYLEQLITALYPDKPAEIQHYWDVMNRLSVEAEPPAATARTLRRILGEL
ncbi:helix-turn-helix domain-containing protein [Sphaerisporangium perillae]|uniref:helix-turn-helix domain-containing protein n=1 Tax=Sphaerisporangium perillae TaxID=2935860 RepID=UPI00200DDEA3|nr:helix-turn-helix transcriptional regulator [Sphaerisporangium perillae]